MSRVNIVGVIMPENLFLEDDVASLDAFKREMAECKDNLDLYIDSPGGDVFTSNSMSTMIAEWCLAHPNAKPTCRIAGLCASAAANIVSKLPSCFTVSCFEDSLFMVHSAYGMVFGGPEALRDNAVLMDLVNSIVMEKLIEKTTLDPERIRDAFREGREMWLDGKEAVSCGLVNELVGGEAGEAALKVKMKAEKGVEAFRYAACVIDTIKAKLKAHKESIMAEVDEKKILAAKAEEEEKEDVPPVDDEDDTDVDAACDDDKTDAKAEDVPEAPADEDPDAACGDDLKQELEALKAEVAALKAENESIKAKYSVKATAKQVEPKKDFAQLVRELPKGLSQDKYAEAYSKLKAEHMEEFEAYMKAHQTR